MRSDQYLNLIDARQIYHVYFVFFRGHICTCSLFFTTFIEVVKSISLFDLRHLFQKLEA